MVASPPRNENIPLYQAQHGGVPADFLVSGNGAGDYCYYRQPNGWITVSPIGKNRSDMHRYQDEGWTPLLREYGPFDFPREYYANHPFEVLFLRGGAAEMPLDQIRALGYDRNPPILPRCNLALGEEHSGPTKRPIHFDRCWMGARPVELPQLAGVTPARVEPCEFCERDDFTSKAGREQHIRVLHIEEMREIAAARETAKGMREAVAMAIQGVGGQRAAHPGLGLPMAGMAGRPFACGYCSETFEKMRGRDPEISLEAHVRLHDEAPDEENEE